MIRRDRKAEQTAGFPAFAEAAVTSTLVAKALGVGNSASVGMGYVQAGKALECARLRSGSLSLPQESQSFPVVQIPEPHFEVAPCLRRSGVISALLAKALEGTQLKLQWKRATRRQVQSFLTRPSVPLSVI